MSWDESKLKKVNREPIPQHYSGKLDDFEPTQGEDGALFTKVQNFPDTQKIKVQGTLADFSTKILTISTSPVELTAGLTGRTQLIVMPPNNWVIYWGKSDVSIATGMPHKIGDEPLDFHFADPSLKIYAISDRPVTVKVVEAK